MRNGLIALAVIGAIAIGTSGAAVAQSCPPGQILQAGVCQAATMPGAPGAVPVPSALPRAGATTTTTTTAAPAGAVSGSSAAPIISPTAGGMAAAEKAAACPAGLALYNDRCYPAQDAANAMMR